MTTNFRLKKTRYPVHAEHDAVASFSTDTSSLQFYMMFVAIKEIFFSECT